MKNIYTKLIKSTACTALVIIFSFFATIITSASDYVLNFNNENALQKVKIAAKYKDKVYIGDYKNIKGLRFRCGWGGDVSIYLKETGKLKNFTAELIGTTNCGNPNSRIGITGRKGMTSEGVSLLLGGHYKGKLFLIDDEKQIAKKENPEQLDPSKLFKIVFTLRENMAYGTLYIKDKSGKEWLEFSNIKSEVKKSNLEGDLSIYLEGYNKEPLIESIKIYKTPQNNQSSNINKEKSKSDSDSAKDVKKMP